MSAKRACCVLGCKDVISKRHRFPKDDEHLFTSWVKNVNQTRFKELNTEQIYRSYFVCDRHFAQEYIVPGTRRGLRKDAVPTLFLSGLTDDADAGVSYSKSGVMQAGDVNPDSRDTGKNEIKEVHWPTLAEQEDEVHQNVDVISPTSLLEQGSSTSGSNWSTESSQSAGVEHASTSKGLLHEIGVTREKHLTPKCKKLYKKCVQWSKRTVKLNKKLKSFNTRLAEAEKFSTKFNHLLDHVNRSTYSFIMQQIRNQNLPPRGRRFTLDEKIFALTLYKNSAKGYRLLAKMFSLPTPRTLSTLLQKISVRPGINDQMFESLKMAIRKMKNRDKYCALLFDEMSIEETLKYNRTLDLIDGFEFLGYSRSTKLADHVNLFMLKGIGRQWKQPVVFTFNGGPIKTTDLKKLILDVISKCQSIGLHVVATICDQGSGNQAAINALLKDTQDNCPRAKAYDAYFLVNGEEIVPLYDVPHLFKGIRNNLLTKILQFQQDGRIKKAKWDHIRQFYFLDAADSTRMCPKLNN